MENLNKNPTSSRWLPQTRKSIHFPRCLPCFHTPAVCSLLPGCHPFRAFWLELPSLDFRVLSPRLSSDLSDRKPLCEVSFLSNTCAHFLEKAFVSLVCVCTVGYNSLSAFSSLWPPVFSASLLCSSAFPDQGFLFSCSGIAPLLLGPGCASMCRLSETGSRGYCMKTRWFTKLDSQKYRQL